MGELKTKLYTQEVESEEERKKRLDKERREKEKLDLYNPIQQLSKILYD